MITEENLIPLAGMFQAGYLIYDIAHTGQTNDSAFKTSLNSILITDAKSTAEVYHDRMGVSYGLELLINIFSKENKQRDMEIARYVLGIVHLEKKMRKTKLLDTTVSAGIERAKTQAEIFGDVCHENVIANLAEVYAESISTLSPKIMVNGEQVYLTDKFYANKIRALLLALMRSTILWLQKGGSRWQLILQREKIIKSARQLKTELSYES